MEIEIENIGGISRGFARLDSGINTVRASNWQGKSSFVHSIRTAFGTAKTLTDGETEGRVRYEYEGDSGEVRLERDGDAVVRHGTPVLDDEYDRTLVDLFAFLGEDNDVRRAVRSGENLGDVLTRPLDMENIDERIRDLSQEREAVETELRRAEETANELTRLKQHRSEVESELADLRERKASLAAEGDSEQREQLSELRAERERVTDLVERLENTLERSRAKLEEAYEEYESLDVEDTDQIEADLAEVRDQHEQASQDEELLQSIYSANKRLLEQDRLDLLEDVDHGLLEDSHVCWLCGSETTRDEMAENLEKLGDKVLDRREEVNSHEQRIEELEARRNEIRQQERRKADLEAEISDLESTIGEREESLESARERLETVEDRIEELSASIADTDDRLSDLESEIKYKEAELDDCEDDIEQAREAADRVEMLEAELENIGEEIRELRERKDRMRARIREAFDEAIGEIVERFETSFETARLTSEFDLIVARDGREVELDALSEGEVELLGLVVAVAGFEAYDVVERTSIILLDELGALADDNLTTLSEYLVERVEMLVVTAYPENSALGDNEIDPTDWDVVSRPRAAAP